jgi:hypothetical protein
MSTMTYKASGRYQFGWNDPRAQDFTEKFEDVKVLVHGHFAQGMTSDQLKAAWILVYGDRPITFYEIRKKWAEDETGDAMRVAQETHLRGLLISQHDFNSYANIYILKDKLNASN